ncbi:ZapG family protein [Pseudoalteromonas fenneropenaei]|uniref:Z-ring associated protein G n=1 Tax=Pseudoalteromonas fenneropenaei TaxID=1737459 RepID=A0ABV7CKF6_9GAMM
MNTFAWVGLLVVVAVAAFFLGALFTKKKFKQDELEQQAADAKHALAQFRQDVADHLDNTRKLVNKMQDNYTQLLNQVEETNQLLVIEKVVHPADPFFSKETTEQLQASLKSRPERRGDRSTASSQPSDFAAGTSGIFSGHSAENEQIKAS